ncbi:MAG: alanine racemase, partial [Alphaproteobacteria bacterium]|nr:alanine racemase [Alphaproteobacteria bacterium]
AANWRDLAARHPAGAVAGVVKADAYGLGAARVAPALFAAGCRHFFVAHFGEALLIRDVLPGAMLAVLNGLVPGSEGLYRAHAITPVLGTIAAIDAWRESGGGEAILHVDTGMNRLGLDAREFATLISEPARLSGIALRYVMTHLVASEEADDPANPAQRDRFAAVRAALPGIPASFANSSGIFLGADFTSDLARPGAALYGINPTPHAVNPMRNVATLRGRVLQVREIATGEGVGYNATWHAARPSRIATVGVGYADGFLRSLSNRGQGFFDGRPVPLVGRVSMDLTTFDVTDFPAIVPGAAIELLGPNLPPDALAAMAGTNGYEILTSLGARYARVYQG